MTSDQFKNLPFWEMNANAEENRARRRVAMNDLDILCKYYNNLYRLEVLSANQKIAPKTSFNRQKSTKRLIVVGLNSIDWT